VQWTKPEYSLARIRFDLGALRPERHFGFSTLLASFAGAVVWHVHPLAIGALIGPGAVAAFHVGMRLPMVLSETNWRTAEVLFPAASRAPDSTAVRTALVTGLRWLTLLVLPAAVLGFVLAPDILDLWLQDVPAGAVAVMRVGMAVIVLDAWAVTALQVLWGLGGALRPAVAMVIAAIVAIAVDLVLVPVLGVLAAPLAIGGGLLVTSIVTLRGAGARAGVPGVQPLTREAVGFAGAALACAIAAVLGGWLGGDRAILRLLLGAAFGLAAFGIVLRFSRELAPGRALLRESLGWTPGDGVGLIRTLRDAGKRSAMLRSTWYLLIVLKERLAYRSRKTSAALDALFATAPDPWRYASPEERARHALATGMLDRAVPPGAFARVLEIGCAEGVFTERLAPRCAELIAADVSAAALARARDRRDWGSPVTFTQLDLLDGTLPGRFSTIVVMDVLTYFQSGAELRGIRAKIVDALEPGGWLLVGDVRQRDIYESAWWGRALLCGGYWICEFMAADERLEHVAEAGTATHVFRLLRRVR
jgi:SAM-dependent methyltransferase